MKKFKKVLSLALVVVVAVTAFTACGSKKESNKGTIKVGSKNFTENLILAEVYSLALEDAQATRPSTITTASSNAISFFMVFPPILIS